jgi:pyruvate formate lyase activating enzyme
MTLLDFPGRVACTVFLAGCQFRCPFCHNSELLDESAPGIMDDAQLLKFLESRRGILEGVAFTGGEPLMRKDLPELLARIKELGYPVKLDTNGALPERLKEVVSTGLVDYVAMDVKNGPARYAETCGLPDMGYDPAGAEGHASGAAEAVKPGSLRAKICESKDFLIAAGQGLLPGVPAIGYEFRTTCVAQLHDAASFEAIGPWIRGAKRYFLQVFTDRETVPFAGLAAPSPEEMRAYADIVRPFVEDVQIRGGE